MTSSLNKLRTLDAGNQPMGLLSLIHPLDERSDERHRPKSFSSRSTPVFQQYPVVSRAKPNVSTTSRAAAAAAITAPLMGLSDIERIALLRSNRPSPPGPSKRNHDAATLIQRHVRGHWQRLSYRLLWLQHRIDTAADRKQAELNVIRQETAQRKLHLRQRLVKRYQVEHTRATQVNALYLQAKHIITYLRKENEHLRLKNTTLEEACGHLQYQNQRIEAAQDDCTGLLQELQDRLAELQATNDYLHKVIPDYKLAIDLLEDKLARQTELCEAETNIKRKCQSTMLSLVQALDVARAKGKLSSDLLDMALEADTYLCLQHDPPQAATFTDDNNPNNQSFRTMGRAQLVQGLNHSLTALHYESDDEDEEIDEYVGTIVAF
jgi:hypothetical protein